MLFIKEYAPFADLTKCKYTTIVLTGGRGSGKTQHAIRAILTACLKKKTRVCGSKIEIMHSFGRCSAISRSTG